MMKACMLPLQTSCSPEASAAGGSYAPPHLPLLTGCAVRGQASRPSPELGQAPPKLTQCGQYCQFRL